MKTAIEILNITEPGELFSGNLDTMKNEYSELARVYHPDINGGTKEANDIMAKINTLYENGMEMVKLGLWKIPGLIKLSGKDGKTYEVRYRNARNFELGTMYIGNTVVLYLLGEEHRDLYENAIKVTGNFIYANNEMEKEFARYLPKILAKFETKDNQLAIVVKKTEDLFLLRDVLEYYDGKIPDRHVAWILSRIYNIASYIDFSNLTHNSITLDTFFISPKYHNGALLGGWWYSVPKENKMLGVPDSVYEVMPPHVKSKKVGNIQTDLEAIKLMARELLGDRNGTRLSSFGMIPNPFIDWVRGVSSTDAINEFHKWSECLTNSYGERKFVEMSIDANELYTKIKNNK